MASEENRSDECTQRVEALILVVCSHNEYTRSHYENGDRRPQ